MGSPLPPGFSRLRWIARAAGAFLPSKVRWQCSPTHRTETVPRSFLLCRRQWLFGWAKRGDSSKKTEPIYTVLAGGKSLIFHPAITELISLRLRAVSINCQGIFTVGNAWHGLLLEAESWTRSSSPCSVRGKKESIANSKPISPSILLPAEKGRKASRLLYWPFSRKCSGLKVSGVSHTFLSNIIEVRLVITVVPCKRWRKQEFAWRRRADVLSD